MTTWLETTWLETTKDMAWLANVHGIDVAGATCAVLYGHESCPARVDVYARNHIDALLRVYLADENGDLQKQGEGN